MNDNDDARQKAIDVVKQATAKGQDPVFTLSLMASACFSELFNELKKTGALENELIDDYTIKLGAVISLFKEPEITGRKFLQ